MYTIHVHVYFINVMISYLGPAMCIVTLIYQDLLRVFEYKPLGKTLCTYNMCMCIIYNVLYLYLRLLVLNYECKIHVHVLIYTCSTLSCSEF